jgi:hypothetical protein
MKKRLPNFFVVGAAKAGTTSLYHYLRVHPQIHMSPIKEPHHFAKDIDVAAFSKSYERTLLSDPLDFVAGDMHAPVHAAHVTEWDLYAQLFRNARDEKAIGEVSNSYLYSSRAAEEIRAAIPDARIIMVLRNPLERAFSQYLMEARIGLVRRSFIEELEEDVRRPDKAWGGDSRCYVEMGLYYEQVRRFLEQFPRERVAIHLFDDMQEDVVGFLGRVYAFLGVDPSFAPPDLTKSNTAQLPRVPLLNFGLYQAGLKTALRRVLPEKMKRLCKRVYYADATSSRLTASDRAKMIGFFRSDVRRLEYLIGRDLSHWTEMPG